VRLAIIEYMPLLAGQLVSEDPSRFCWSWSDKSIGSSPIPSTRAVLL
jgi:hypothetical protein